MLMNEILDPERKSQLDAVMKNLRHQYLPRPERSPEETAVHQRRSDDIQAKRKRIDNILEPIAAKLGADEFDRFEQQAREVVPEAELKLVDLRSVFNRYNPQVAKSFNDFWNSYGEHRAKGGPMTHGPGLGSEDNWTGD